MRTPIRILIGLTLVGFIVATTSMFITSCGSDGPAASFANTFRGLDQLPSASSIVSGTGANAALQAVSGTAPLMISLSSSNVDTYFFNGLIATINTAQSATQAQAQQFFGSTVGGPGGQGACMVAQATAESVGRMLSSATSQCYMKNMVNVTSGVTVTGDTAATLFTQSTTDKIVKVSISGEMPHRSGGQPEQVFIKIVGSDTTGAGVYQAILWFCSASRPSPSGKETITVDVNNSTYQTSNQGSYAEGVNSGSYSESLSSALTLDAAGNIVFDATQDRTATATYSYVGGWGTGSFKGQIRIASGDVIYAKRYNVGDGGGGGRWYDFNYSIAAYTGSAVADLRFLQAAYKGRSKWTNDRTTETHNYSGATEYQNTSYVAADTATNSLYSGLADVSFDTDSFFTTALVASSPDVADVSCTATPTAEVSMDFSDAAVSAVSESCEADRIENYDMCWGQAVQTAQNYIWQSNNMNGR